MGKQAIMRQAEQDPLVLPEGTVASVSGTDDFETDHEMFMRISPIDSLRKALEPAALTDDEWVNAELRGPLGEVFGPLPKEPADSASVVALAKLPESARPKTKTPHQ